MQPAATQRRCRRLGIVPVARHHHVAAAQNFASLAGCQRAIVAVGDHHFEAAEGPAGGAQPFGPARMIAVGDLLFRQSGDGHRAFALAVDLRETRAEAVDGGARIGDIHRRAAPDDGFDAVGIALRVAFNEPLDHGRRGEHRGAWPRIDQLHHLVGFEAARFRHDVDAEPRHVRHHVKAGAVAHRCGMQERAAGRDGIDLARISEARGRKHAMGEHGALRPARGAGGVEQPGEIVAAARPRCDRIGGKQRLVVAAADHDHAFQRRRRVRCDLGIEPVGREADAGAGMLQNVAELAAVQFGIGRHRGKSRVPNAEHELHIIGAVLRRYGDTLTRLKTEALA